MLRRLSDDPKNLFDLYLVEEGLRNMDSDWLDWYGSERWALPL